MRVLALLLSAFLVACSQGDARQRKDDAKGAPEAVPVSVIEVAPREVPVSFEAVGRTEGSREVQIRARVTGILEKQLYTEGDSVKPGDVLFQIERAPFEIELAQARGTLAQEQAREGLAVLDHERLKSLADRRAISQKEADQAASALQQARGAVQVARARVRQAELNLSYTTVSAQIDGITGRALQSIGSLVSPTSESAMLTTLTRGDPLWVRFALSEAEYATVRANDPKAVEVKLETADGDRFNFDERSELVLRHARLTLEAHQDHPLRAGHAMGPGQSVGARAHQPGHIGENANGIAIKGVFHSVREYKQRYDIRKGASDDLTGKGEKISPWPGLTQPVRVPA